MNNDDTKKDSFTIGTPSTGGAIKVYFEDITDYETVDKKISSAVEWYFKAKKAVEKLKMINEG